MRWGPKGWLSLWTSQRDFETGTLPSDGAVSSMTPEITELENPRAICPCYSLSLASWCTSDWAIPLFSASTWNFFSVSWVVSRVRPARQGLWVGAVDPAPQLVPEASPSLTVKLQNRALERPNLLRHLQDDIVQVIGVQQLHVFVA